VTMRVSMPLLASNMESVISEPLAEVLLANGTLPIFHRFTDHARQQQWVRRFGDRTFVSAGLQDIDEVRALLDLGPAGVCIDIAHGHSDRMMHFITELKRTHPDQEIIAGNVCTPMAFHDLVNAGADAVKVGVGPGAPCSTRMVTGFGVPQFTAIRECAEVADKLRVPLIADGGVRGSREAMMALAAGASTVMLGKLFALTAESAAPKRNAVDGSGRQACYRGQASAEFQRDFYGGLKPNTVAEGVAMWAPVSGPAQVLIDRILGGLRSGLTYGGARSIKELQRKAEFVEVGPGYGTESAPRPG